MRVMRCRRVRMMWWFRALILAVTTAVIAAGCLCSVQAASSGTDDSTSSEKVYLSEYFGFTREDVVSYLYSNMDTFIGTPYHESADEVPTPGPDGHMQCEGFVWYVLHAVATENTENIPCGDASTEPYENGGGWVNWLYYGSVKFEIYNTIDEMLDSGTMRKGDIIWLFDANGPYSISDSHHTGFFWGDTSDDDKFWHSSQLELSETYAGEEAENRISKIEGMTEESNISQIWVIHLDGSGGAGGETITGEDASGEVTDADIQASLPDPADYAGVFDADWYREQLNGGMTEENSAVEVTVGSSTYSIPRGSVNASDMTDAELLQYFLLSGIWYGDQASADFDITWYMAHDQGLDGGADRLAYVSHYLNEGQAAGEAGVGENDTEGLTSVSTTSDGTVAAGSVQSVSTEASSSASGTSGGGISTGAVILIILVCVAAAAALFLWLRSRWYLG